MPKLLGLTQSAFDPASRFRFMQFIPHLQRAGWNVDHRPNKPDRQWNSTLSTKGARALHYRAGRLMMKANRLRDLADSRLFDVVFVNRDFAAEGSLFQKIFASAVRKTVFDFDDAIFVGPKEKLVRWMCANSCWVTPGNEYLANYARQFTERVTVIPTVIDTDSYLTRNYGQPVPERPTRIGWSGSDQSIQATLVPHLPMLEALHRQVQFQLVVITNTEPKLPTELRWKFVRWEAAKEPFLKSQFDIGIMPLVDDNFQKGKCALKLLQYMAAGLPTIASPVGVNREVVQQGNTGFLATTEAEWHEALTCLLKNPGLRAAMGVAGRLRCEKEYSVHRWLPVLLDIFEKVAPGIRSHNGF